MSAQKILGNYVLNNKQLNYEVLLSLKSWSLFLEVKTERYQGEYRVRHKEKELGYKYYKETDERRLQESARKNYRFNIFFGGDGEVN